MANDGDGIRISFHLNGRTVDATVRPQTHIADLLRNEFCLTGTHIGCEHGVCGACNIMIDDVVVRGCLYLAIQADGARVVTIEGLTETGAIADLQATFVRLNALQCGFCTPGMLMTAAELLSQSPAPTREETRHAISGNYCRCTGYQAIVDAIGAVASDRSEKAQLDG